MSAARRHKKRGILTGTAGAALATALGITAIAVLNNSASAAIVRSTVVDPADTKEVNFRVDECNGLIRDKQNGANVVSNCKWTDIKVTTVDGKSVIVGDNDNAQKFVNCGTGTLRETVSWSRGSQTAVTIAASVAFKGEVSFLIAAFEASGTITGSTAWTFERTYTNNTTVEVPPGETGWITHAEKRIKGTGTLDLQLRANTPGDFLQFLIKDVEIDSPAKEAGGSIVTHTRKHTAADKEICANNAEPAGPGETGALIAADGSDLPDTP
ncbi:hypothetical protein [Streptomyces sp. NBC_01451]|uniref:hypothetical protein n=1 Tax=Streptomyces sp. NBC_01451 TaxID=2903872 RepID=UPI002E3479A1|nr:hypothetical protein [Streptomyces sp. NBC_01451]